MSTSSSNLNSRATLLFLLAASLTVGWLGVGYAFPDAAPTGIPNMLLLILLCNGILLAGLWLGLSRTDFTPGTRITVWLAIAVPFIVWTAAIWILSERGAFQPRGGLNRLIPALPFAILVPVPLGLVLLTYSKRVAALLDATPPSWLIGVQVYRILGAIFLANWMHGTLPGAFALPAGIGDILVGLLALPAALWASSGTARGRKIGVYWNLLGLADFAVAIATGMMTSPGRFQLLALDHPNAQIGTFPTVMIPAFAVPNSIILHGLSLWQLRRLAGVAARTPTVEPTERQVPGAASINSSGLVT
jgi:hypothetical protein